MDFTHFGEMDQNPDPKWVPNHDQIGPKRGPKPVTGPKNGHHPGGQNPFVRQFNPPDGLREGSRPHPKMTKMGSQMDTPKMVIFGHPKWTGPKQDLAMF